jgi:nucleoid-associated protein
MPEAEQQAAEQIKLTTVKHAIVHTMVVERDKVQVDPRLQELEIGPLVQRLVDTLYSVYRRRASKSHGKFNGNEETAPAQRRARDYLLDAAETDFCRFTKNMAELLCDKAKNTGATTGHVFFAHIEGDGREYLLIAIVTNEIDLALSKAKELEETEHLDLKDFRFAGRIDVSAWRDNQDRYVSFLKGTKEVSNYFMAFLGCDTTIAALKDTLSLTNAVKRFAQAAQREGQPLSEEDRDKFLSTVDAHCRTIAARGQPLEIDALCNAAWPEAPHELRSAIVEGEEAINDGFTIDRRGLRGLVHFSGKGAYWKLEFEREALSSHKLTLNKQDRTITLHEPSEELVQQLLQEQRNVEH